MGRETCEHEEGACKGSPPLQWTIPATCDRNNHFIFKLWKQEHSVCSCKCWEANPISNEGVLSVNIETCICIVAFMIHFSLVS